MGISFNLYNAHRFTFLTNGPLKAQPKSILRSPFLANFDTRSSQERLPKISFSIDANINACRRCCVIVVRSLDLMSANFEKDRSTPALVTGSVSKIW